MTKIDIISGFLGAGKTTLIKKLLKEAFQNEQVVLIENEFGEIGIDGGFLKEAGVEIREMNSGCICCSLVGDFGTSLKEVIETYHPDRILIEPSGVGKLSDVIKAVENVKDSVDIVLNSYTTVVDVNKCKLYLKNFGEFYSNQVETAGAIILSRTDVAKEGKAEEAVKMLREMNANAAIITTPIEQLDGAKILETMEHEDSLEKQMLEEELRHQHDHEHEHHHDDDCCCGHDHHEHDHHEHDHHEHHHVAENIPADHTTKVYTIENLGCANCAAKMESRINQLEEVSDATITFATKQLRVSAKNPDALLNEIQEICAGIEVGVQVVEKKEQRQNTAQKRERKAEQKKELYTIIAGAVLFLGTVLVNEVMGYEDYSFPFFLAFAVSYLILGGEVLLSAGKNILKGQMFDENFLMSIATLGSFAIHKYPEAVGVMLFFRIGEFFEDVAVEKSRSQIMEAVDLRPEVVLLEKDGQITEIPAEEAKAGDIVQVRPGDRIPLDGVVIEGESRIDTSAVTGEPVPVAVREGSEAVSGCVNISGLLRIRVEKPLEESMVSRILNSVENAAAGKPKIDHFITRFARVYTPIVVALALFTAIAIPLITGQEFYPWIYTALSFLVMSCPCAVVLSVPLAFFCGIGAGSKRGILFKGGVAIEALKNVKAVVMDKTGTITKGNFDVQKVLTQDEWSEEAVLSMAAACESASTHPIAVSIVTAAKNKNLSIEKPSEIEEISGKGIRAIQNGRQLLCGNVKLMQAFDVDLSSYQKEGSASEVLLAVDKNYAGCIIVSDTLKEEAPKAIARIKGQNLKTVMLTGDALESAEEIAALAGVEEVHARLLPEDKLSELQKIREKDGSVMFVGDGINDAPVLSRADIGIAMGAMGSDAAIEAADIVLMDDDPLKIATAIHIARKCMHIVYENIYFAIGIKLICLLLGALGIANMWMAIFADVGVMVIAVVNAIRALFVKKYEM